MVGRLRNLILETCRLINVVEHGWQTVEFDSRNSLLDQEDIDDLVTKNLLTEEELEVVKSVPSDHRPFVPWVPLAPCQSAPKLVPPTVAKLTSNLSA